MYNDTTWLAGDVGYIFQRVFEGTPAVNSWYFDSTPVALDSDPVTYQESYIEGSPSASEGVQPDSRWAARFRSRRRWACWASARW
jgi:hypothetical protein